jgi:hypothetical protein
MSFLTNLAGVYKSPIVQKILTVDKPIIDAIVNNTLRKEAKNLKPQVSLELMKKGFQPKFYKPNGFENLAGTRSDMLFFQEVFSRMANKVKK